MIAYASRTGTRRNIEAWKEHGWRVLLNPVGRSALRNEGLPYALESGAWPAYCQGKAFCERSFGQALRKVGADADWAVLPDIVAGGLPSLELSLKWMRRVLDEAERCLIAVQDGMEAADVEPFLGHRVGIFVGGSTAWKISTTEIWGALGQKVGCWVHVGRVNTARRIRLCGRAGAHSFDGTSTTKWAVTTPPLSRARDQAASQIGLPFFS